MAGLIIFGAISFSRMGISQLPDADFPIISVSVTYEGASPEVMEQSVSDILEDSVMTIAGIRSTSSVSRYGMAVLTIEFDLSRNIDSALQEVQTKITQAQRMLPREMDPPVITKLNPEDQPIMFLSLSSSKHTQRELMKYVRDTLKGKFSTVPGTGDVFLGGYIEPNLRVWVHNEALKRYELSVTDVLDTIQNEHAELPAGQIETSRREVDVRTMGEAKSLEDFSNIVISKRGGMPNYTPIRLNQVATIEEGLADVRKNARANGMPSVGLGIKKQRGSNAVEVAKAVKKRILELGKSLPEGMSLNITFDSTHFIEESVGELNFTLILSALLTGIVCWIFLGSWSSTINVLLAIPTSIVGAFMIIYFMGFTLNTFTLLGLSLAIGIVVDDAIMVLENIIRHKEMGKSRLQAAYIGSKEITFAAIAASIAIIAIFLPVAFMRGVIGKFFFQFGVTMTATVALSLLEALTLTPMRCSQFIETGERTTRFGRTTERTFKKASALYSKGLEWSLSHRWKVLIASMVFSLASCASVKWINKEFSPAQDQSMMMIRVTTPIDSSMQYTDTKFKEIETYLGARKEVLRYFSIIGGMQGGEVNGGVLFVTLVPPKERGQTQQQLMDVFRDELAKIKDVQVFMQDLSMRGFTASRGYPIEFTVRGQKWDLLAKYSTDIMEEMKKNPLYTDTDTDYKLGKPEAQIFPDRVKASLRGVSIRTISETVNALVGGALRGKFEEEGHRYDIRVRMASGDRDRTEQIKSLYVRNNRGELVPLADVIRIEERSSLQQINRYDRERAVSIFSNIARGKSQSVAIEEVQKIGAKILPQGYRLVMSGSAETMKESFSDLILALVLGIIVAYMVLASQFNSFIDPVTVLMALPFSLSGAFLALFITHQSINIYSFIGLILLMGIVKKNSILLVEFTNHQRDVEKIHDVREALLRACPIRLRPILMTSFATIAGAIPPALAIGPGAETRVPMSLAVIGGVLVSTFLTLFVVPCVYSLFSKISRRRHIELHEE